MIEKGFDNLKKQISNVKLFGVNVVVAVNKFKLVLIFILNKCKLVLLFNLYLK